MTFFQAKCPKIEKMSSYSQEKEPSFLVFSKIEKFFRNQKTKSCRFIVTYLRESIVALVFIREKEITNLRFLFLYSRENKISKAYRYFRIIGGNKSTCRWLSIASQFNQRLTTLPGIYLPKSLFFKTLSYSEEKEASSVSLLQFSLIFHFPSLFLHF